MHPAHDLNRRLWQAYERALDVGTTTPLAFIIRARTEDDARAIATRLGAQVVWLKKRRWPFGRRWELALKGRPVTLTLEAIDDWSDEVVHSIAPYDALLTHWVPAPAGA